MTTTKIDSNAVVGASKKAMEYYEKWEPLKYPTLELDDIKSGDYNWYIINTLHNLASNSVNGLVEIDDKDFDLISEYLPKVEPTKPKGTTPDQIRFAYGSTTQCSIGLSFEDCLSNKDGRPLRTKTIQDILKYLRLEGNPFGCEGPVDRFIAIYKMGEFEIVVQAFDCNNTVRIYTAETFADWLNECERKVLEAANNLTKEHNEP